MILKRNIFFAFFISYILLEYVFYNVVNISFLDEFYAVILLGSMFLQKIRKEFLFFIVVFVFYVLYSFFYSVNPSKMGIASDAIQQLKPFVFFYYFEKNPIAFTNHQKTVLKETCIISSVLLLASYMIWGLKGGLISHPFILGISTFSFAILYDFLSSDEKTPKVKILIILCIGLLSLRAKFFGEFLLYVVLLFAVKQKINFNIKYIIIGLITCLGVYYLVFSKFVFYFVDSDGAARFLLYKTMPRVIMDYIPFGSGFASFATYASGLYYSPLYYKYGIAFGYGMSEENFTYIADTYFPVLAQFGIVGVILFCLFWIRRYKNINIVAKQSIRNYRIGLLIIAMVMIESVAGPVFVMAYNFIPMAILGSICGESNPRDDNERHV